MRPALRGPGWRGSALALALLLTSTVASTITSCSDDAPAISKEKFVDQIKGLQPGVDPGIGSCVYDNIKGDKVVMADLAAHGAASNQISEDSSQKLSRLLARCIRGAENGG